MLKQRSPSPTWPVDPKSCRQHGKYRAAVDLPRGAASQKNPAGSQEFQRRAAGSVSLPWYVTMEQSPRKRCKQR